MSSGSIRMPKMLDAGPRQNAAAGISNVTFIEGGDSMSLFPSAARSTRWCGRRVLMYCRLMQRERWRSSADAIRPGGVIAFHEHDMVEISDGRDCCGGNDRVRSWLREMLRLEGANPSHGGRASFGAFRQGSGRAWRAEANVLTPTADYPIASIIRAVLPRLRQLGVATRSRDRCGTVDERPGRRAETPRATCLWEMVFASERGRRVSDQRKSQVQPHTRNTGALFRR